MPISEKDRNFMEEVAAYFRTTKAVDNPEGSLRDTAIKFGINRNKVRKILITTGDITSPITQRALKLKGQGMSIATIANKLHVSTATVSTYLPYDGIIKNGFDPAPHTQAVRDYRAYERRHIEKQVQNNSKSENMSGFETIDSFWKDEWKDEIKLSYTETDTRPSRMTWDDADALRTSIDFSDVEEVFGDPIKIWQDKENADRLELEKLRSLKKPDEVQKKRITELETEYGLYTGALVRRRNKELEAISGERLPFEPRDVLRLHMELVDCNGDGIDEKTQKTLRKYGGVKFGNTISRDVVVPSDIPLYAIHYMIQRIFGWQNSHLHKFDLPEKALLRITDNKSGMWADLVGIIFRSPFMNDRDLFWADDYKSGSFKNWLTKKYTGPYLSQCHGEGFVACKRDMGRYPENDEMCYVLFNKSATRPERAIVMRPVYGSNGKNPPPENYFYDGEDRVETMCFDDVPIEALFMTADRSCFDLIERLPVDCLLTNEQECNDITGLKMLELIAAYAIHVERSHIDSPTNQVFPQAFTDTIYYSYDFGDGWKIKITVMDDCRDLVEQGRITQLKIDRANIKCRELYRPVTLAADGEMLLDDIGGVSGYADFLDVLNDDTSGMNEEERAKDKAEKKEILDWARNIHGWRKLSPMI